MARRVLCFRIVFLYFLFLLFLILFFVFLPPTRSGKYGLNVLICSLLVFLDGDRALVFFGEGDTFLNSPVFLYL